MADIFDMLDTWNDGATIFTAIKMDVTDTASNAASKLLDLQVGSSSLFSVSKTGAISTAAVEHTLGNYVFDSDQTVGAGQDNYVLTYDHSTGKIGLEAASGGGGGLTDIVNDLTPQLGGNLDVNGNKIVSVSNGNIDIEPNGTGNVLLGNFVIDADATIGAGQDNYVLTYDHASGTWGPEAAAGGGGLTLPYSDGDSVTGSASTKTFELTPTWNTTGTPIALNIDVTRTAAADGNNLIAARYNSTSNPAFGVASVTGTSATLNGVNMRNATAATAVTIGTNAITNVTNGMGLVVGGVMIANITRFSGLEAMDKLGIYSGFQTLNSGGKADVELYRDAANTLALRNGTNAQTFNIYNTYTDASNYERAALTWDTNVFKITSQAAGTGTIRNVAIGNYVFDVDQTVGAGQDNYVLTYDNATGLISLEVAPGAGGGISNVVEDTTPQLGGSLDVNGQSIVSVSNGDITIAPNGTGSIISSSQSLTGTAADALLDLSTTWNTTGSPTAIKLNVTNTASGGSSQLIDIQSDGTTRFAINSAAEMTGVGRWSANQPIIKGGGTDVAAFRSNLGLNINRDLWLGWAATTNVGTVGDIQLHRDAAGALASRVGTSAQTFRIYNTWTDASNYERLEIGWGSNIMDIGPEAAGTGVVRPMRFGMYGEKVNAIGSIGGGTQDIDLRLGNVVTGTVDTSTTTFTFSNPIATGSAHSFTLILTNGGSQTVNWPASVDWAGGSPPTLTAAGVDVLTFTTVDGGTTWYGFPAGINMS